MKPEEQHGVTVIKRHCGKSDSQKCAMTTRDCRGLPLPVVALAKWWNYSITKSFAILALK